MAQVNLITTEIITAEQARAAAASVGSGEGTEANPYKIKTKADLEALRASVADGNCFEGKFFLQTTDIDMEAEPWAGIGLKIGDGPDPDRTFKGTYDGGGHAISNVLFAYNEDPDDDSTNELLGFFRSCIGATIKNLTVNVLGFNVPASPGQNFGGAAIVGTVCNGITMINCTANGTLGTIDCPCKHTTAGIIANIEVPTAFPAGATDEEKHSACKTILSFVTNNVNVFSCRKAAGIIGLLTHDLELNNVVNNGAIMHSFLPEKRTDDGIGAIYAHSNANNNGWRSIIKWNNVANTGVVYSDRTATPELIGQLAGVWGVDSRSVNVGSVKLTMNDKALPLASNNDGNNMRMNVFFGEVLGDGFCYVVKTPKAGGEYVYLSRAVCPTVEVALNKDESFIVDFKYAPNLPASTQFTLFTLAPGSTADSIAKTQIDSTTKWKFEARLHS